jgi:large conductance mechanosensitive channel
MALALTAPLPDGTIKTHPKKEREMIKEFKAFIMRGNVMDLAVAVIIGGAFGKIVTSLVSDIIMPLIGLILGGVDFSGLAFTLGSAKVTYGNFINNIIDFVIIALVIFLMIKGIDSLKKKPAPVVEEPVTKECPHCYTIIPIKATRCPNCTSELG